MVNRLAANREARLAIPDHHTSVGVDPEQITHVALRRLAMWAFLALPGEHREDVVTRGNICHALSNTLHYVVSINKFRGRAADKFDQKYLYKRTSCPSTSDK